MQYKRRAQLYVLQTYTNTSVKLSRNVRLSAHLYTILIAVGIAFIAVVIAVALIQDDIEQGFFSLKTRTDKNHSSFIKTSMELIQSPKKLFRS